jgi:hypothetical protein
MQQEEKMLAARFSIVAIAVAMIGTPCAAADYYEATCTSQGQECDRYVSVPIDTPNQTIVLVVAAPESHCSAVAYTVKSIPPASSGRFAPIVLARSRALQPGSSQRLSITPPMGQVRIYARGFEGGCNQGRLSAWGVNVSFRDGLRQHGMYQ